MKTTKGKNLKELRKVGEYSIVCSEDDTDAIENHCFLENDCIDRRVCNSCANYVVQNNKEIWVCKKGGTDNDKTMWFSGGVRNTIGNEIYGRLFHDGMRIPYYCDRKLEHILMSQKMENIDD